MPKWMKFIENNFTFAGVPNEYNNYTIKVTASDAWESNTYISFMVYTGRVFTYGPLVGTLLVD